MPISASMLKNEMNKLKMACMAGYMELCSVRSDVRSIPHKQEETKNQE
jgi:hypothetical protein